MSHIDQTPSPANTLTAAHEETPVAWPLRAWFIAEIFFAIASSWAIFLAPQSAATNFAWPIQPAVTAALFGAIYLSALPLMAAGFFTRIWERVRVIVLPSAVFTAVMLLPTFLHFDRFATGSVSFAIWLASYVLPPPVLSRATCGSRSDRSASDRELRRRCRSLSVVFFSPTAQHS